MLSNGISDHNTTFDEPIYSNMQIALHASKLYTIVFKKDSFFLHELNDSLIM